MFDLRTVLLAELNTFSTAYIDVNKDMNSTVIALADTELVVFVSGACVIGDWNIIDREPLFFNTNRVTNEVELIVMAKSAAAIAGIDTMADALSLALDNNRMGRADILTINVTNIAETIKLKPHFYYKILTLEIVTTEKAGERSCPVPGVLTLSDIELLSAIEVSTITVDLSLGSIFTPARYLWIFDFSASTGPLVCAGRIAFETTVPTLDIAMYDYLDPTNEFTLECIALDSTNSKYITTGVQNGTTGSLSLG